MLNLGSVLRVIQADDVQDIQVLPLVFMDALDLHVEDRRGIHHHAGALFDQCRKGGLVRVLDLAPFGAELGVVGQRFELAQLREIAHPVVADALRDAV